MATVATVYTVDRHVRTPEEVFPPPGPHRVPLPPRPSLASKRVWASVEEEMEDVVKAMFLEAASRDPEHAREWVVVLDGNEQQIRLVHEAAKAAGVRITVILDVIHVLEYVWAAGLALNPDDRPGTSAFKVSRSVPKQTGSRDVGLVKMLGPLGSRFPWTAGMLLVSFQNHRLGNLEEQREILGIGEVAEL